MKVSYNWLSEYLNFSVSHDKISSILTATGLEVEGVCEIFASFDHLVVGKVLECVQHPNADRLKITQVDVGNGVNQIICGAKNVRKDQLVIVVLAGNQLINQKGDVVKIKKTKIRGEVSDGMICGEDEIGLGGNHEGIMELIGDVKPGSLARDFLQINKDYILEIGLTPNRTDAFGHFGVCRDLYAYFQHKGEKLHLSLPDVSSYSSFSSGLSCQLDIQDTESCPQYYGVCIDNIIVDSSPMWLQNKLISIGLKPINNVVDITNFVLHETGNPLHAFDYDKINGKIIVVRKAKAGEQFQTLDDNKITLSQDDLVICDINQPICLAGVMGGVNSGVTSATKSIFLESAYFIPTSVRKTSKSHGIISDSSYRFERGVDFNNCEYALKRAALLIQEICGGKICKEVYYNSKSLKNTEIEFSFALCDKVLGHNIDDKEKIQILNSLGFTILSKEKDGCRLRVPAFRADVERSIDVVEEIGRVYGYDNLPSAKFFNFQAVSESNFSLYDLKLKLSNLLVANGFFEIQCNSLVPADVVSLFNDDVSPVKLLNPLSQDLSIMRPNMFFGGLKVVKYNLNRQIKNLKLFEFGKVYSCLGKKYLEKDKLTILACGIFKDDNWYNPSREIDFFLIKGVLHKLLNLFQIDESCCQIDKTQNDYSDLNLSYNYGGSIVAQVGAFSTKTLHKLGVKKMVYYLDIDLQILMSMLSVRDIKYSATLKYPAISRDLALLVDNNVTYAEIKNCVMQYNSTLLKEVSLFDVYEGGKIDKNKKSYALSFLFQDINRTLTDKEIDVEMRDIYNCLESKFQLSLRDGKL